MIKEITVEETEKKIEQSLECLRIYFDSLVENDSKKAKTLSYWLNDYTNYLSRERKFDPKLLPRYKRGQIIKANLGFNVGSEFGGLHYCVVVESNNALSNPVITVIPLKSLKKTEDLERLHTGDLYLGNELYGLLNAKIKSSSSELRTQIRLVKDDLRTVEASLDESKLELVEHLAARISDLEAKQAEIDKMKKELSRMKQGSIALVNQITTISKMRIYDPRGKDDVLTHIRLSDEKLDMIDKKVVELFTKKL